MYVLRRHSRRLLLPPGWVALGFLLLLGCQALLAHRQQVQGERAIQLRMPPLKPVERIERNIRQDASLPYLSERELDHARPWRTIDFTGKPLNDFMNTATIDVALQTMNADTSQAGGVRIRFRASATYSNLIEALDLVKLNGQQKYFLDIRHNPVTLYAITDAHVRNLAGRQSSYDSCFMYSFEGIMPSLAEATVTQLLIIHVWQQAWRLFVVFFIVITSLSLFRFYRLAR